MFYALVYDSTTYRVSKREKKLISKFLCLHYNPKIINTPLIVCTVVASYAVEK